MPLSKDDIQACASRRHQAEKTRVQIRQLSQDFPDISIANVYAIQKAWVDVKIAEGRIARSHKIGVTSKAMQSALDIHGPDSGVLAGSFIPIETRNGDTIQADYGAYGSVSCYFA